MKYICECALPCENNENRCYTLSSNEKLHYIISILNKNNIPVDIVSPSRSLNKLGWYSSRKDELSNSNTLISGSTFGGKNAITKVFQKVNSLVWLFFYLLKHCKRNETVFVYHSLFYSPAIALLKKLKKLLFIIEVEEIFYDLQNLSDHSWRKKAEDNFINYADAYLFASTQLEAKCNKDKKPYVIINGKYELPPMLTQARNDGKTHLVYAGLLENGKVAFKSAEIARYLPDSYVIHILGYGKETDIELLKTLAAEINLIGGCQVEYDGTLRGDEYNFFLQSCHIGLCPLTNDNNYQSACFPSKITSYLSNGLKVITTENEVIRTSAYGNIVLFVADDLPQNFAKVILENKNAVSSENPREVIRELDAEFTKNIGLLLENLNESISDRRC